MYYMGILWLVRIRPGWASFQRERYYSLKVSTNWYVHDSHCTMYILTKADLREYSETAIVARGVNVQTTAPIGLLGNVFTSILEGPQIVEHFIISIIVCQPPTISSVAPSCIRFSLILLMKYNSNSRVSNAV